MDIRFSGTLYYRPARNFSAPSGANIMPVHMSNVDENDGDGLMVRFSRKPEGVFQQKLMEAILKSVGTPFISMTEDELDIPDGQEVMPFWDDVRLKYNQMLRQGISYLAMDGTSSRMPYQLFKNG